MALDTLVITADPDVHELVRHAMQSLGAEVIAVATFEEGEILLARRKFDAIVIDYDDDDVSGANRLLSGIRRGTSNRSSIVFALIGSASTSHMALAGGANFVLQKPLVPERAARAFRSAQGLIRRENRRYFRLAVELPVTLEIEDGTVHRSVTINLSKTGLALRECVLPAGTGTRIKIFLPESHPVECNAEVAWTSRVGSGPAGLQILAIATSDREKLADLIDRAADEAELASPPSHRHRSVMIVEPNHWWQRLRRHVLRSVGRWSRKKH